MLNKFRQRLSVYRNSRAPIASFVDFSLWTLRVGLPPWKLKFWLVFGVLVIGLLASALLHKFMLPLLLLTILFGGLVLLMLVLSYVRTIMSSGYSLLERSNEQIAGRVSRLNDSATSFVGSESGSAVSSNLSSEALVTAAVAQIMESKFFDVFAKGHDDLRDDVERLQAKFELIDHQSQEVSDLRAELAAVSRRTERQFRMEANTIEFLSSHVQALNGQLSPKTAKPPKRSSTRKKSA